MLLYALIFIPLAFALAALLLPSDRLRPMVIPAAALLHLAVVFWVLGGPSAAAQSDLIGLDALGSLILLVVSLLFSATSIYALGYFQHHRGQPNRIFVMCLLLFLSAASLATMARHLGLLWVAMEATTLASAPLIYYNRTRFSIEATWKYLLLCSVGIALAMLGLLFVAYAGLLGTGKGVLQLQHILATASSYSKPWLRAGFVFLLVGFGSKMGLAPLHNWKPDAYGEAPGLVGGLLSGGLTSVAVLAIFRVMQVMGAAGELVLARQALLLLGVCSLVFAAIFVIRQRDIKRMLAYSSVEHMGILAIGISIGGLATYGAMFHLFNNALAKGVLFMTAGNIHRYCGSKKVCEIQGALSYLPMSGSIFLAGFLAVAGSPPFAVFISEFKILQGMIAGGHYLLCAVFLLMLAVIFLGMAGTVLPATIGTPMEEAGGDNQYRDTFLTTFTPLLLLVLVLGLGIWLPEPLRLLFTQAASLLEETR